jgi:hypothetical protein
VCFEDLSLGLGVTMPLYFANGMMLSWGESFSLFDEAGGCALGSSGDDVELCQLLLQALELWASGILRDKPSEVGRLG